MHLIFEKSVNVFPIGLVANTSTYKLGAPDIVNENVGELPTFVNAG